VSHPITNGIFHSRDTLYSVIPRTSQSAHHPYITSLFKTFQAYTSLGKIKEKDNSSCSGYFEFASNYVIFYALRSVAVVSG
jgi:hypothetical protein